MKRTASQFIFLFLAVFLIWHGMVGPQFAPKNLTTLFTWVHYRGVLIFTLLLAGNYFCTTCPMLLVRNIARRFISPRLEWPRQLKTKWLGIALFVAILFTYEAWDLWASPFLTSILILTPFVLILLIDLTFKKAAFCKYVCPIGQFNFVSALISPQEVRVKSKATCADCKTYECLHGNPQKQGPGQLGCELDLFLPYKVGNMDCTFCMECVHACPYDNVAVLPRVPASELINSKHRAGVGKLTERNDITWLILVFVMGALLNAFGMIGPTYVLQEQYGEWPVLLALFFVFLVAIPLLLKSIFPKQLMLSLIPLGFSIWVAHYSFHFFTGIFTYIPVVQGLLGIPGQFPIQWMGLPTRVVYPFEFGFIGLGFLGSLFVTSHTMLANKMTRYSWIAVLLILTVVAVWMMAQPMEMRGVAAGIN